MNNPGVQHATEAARAVGGLVALPGLGRKADFWDLWAEHGTDITRERILAAKAPEPAASSPTDTPAPAPTPTATQLPEGYLQSEEGLFFQPPGQNKDGNPLPPIRLGSRLDILARSRDGQSEEWGLLLGWVDPDGVAHKWSMPYAMLSDARQIWATLSAGGYIPAPGKQARALLAQLLGIVDPVARARCVPRPGWYPPCFVFPDATYGQSPEQIIIPHAGTENPYRVAGDLPVWQETIGTWCQGNSRLTLAVSTALAGPLLSLVGMENGCVHFYGTGSTGKTTSLKAAWSVYGPPQAALGWAGTAFGIENVATTYADTLLPLDEIHRADPKILGDVIYMLMNGRGKIRGAKAGGNQRVQAWTIMAFSTGERTARDRLAEIGLELTAGQEVRLVDVLADAGHGMGAWEDLHGHSTASEFAKAIESASAEHYGTLGRAWIAYLIGHLSEVRNLRPLIQQTAQTWTAGAESGQVVRVAERFSLIGLAGELAAQVGLVPWAEGESLQAAQTCLNTWLAMRGGLGDREDMQAVAIIRGYVARYGASRFQRIGIGADDIVPGHALDRLVERAGFRRTTPAGEEQFIFTDEQWLVIFAGRDPVQAAKALDRAGMLVRNDKSLKQKISLPDMGRPRAYVVRIAPDTGEGAP